MMSETTSPAYIHLLSPSSSMSSNDSAPQSEPTSDEQPDLGAFTTVLRAWTYLQPPPRIPVQIHFPTTSTTTTFQPDQSVVDSDFQSTAPAPPSSSFIRPESSNILHEESSHTLPPSSSSFTRPPSSSVLNEESTVWNHAPIASYLYSGTPSFERITDEDENSVGSTEGGRTVEINSELSFDGHSSSVPSQAPYPDVSVPIPLVPSSLLLPPSDSPPSQLTSFGRNPLSYSSTLSLLSYQIPETPTSESDHGFLVVAQRVLSTTAPSSATSKVGSSNVNSITTPTFCPPLALPVQHRTVLIHPPISDDASVSNLSLPPPIDSPLPPMPNSLHPNLNPNPNPYLPQQQPCPISLPQLQPQPPRFPIETSIFSRTRTVGGGEGTIVVDDLRTQDGTPEPFLVDWKNGRRNGMFSPVDDDREEQDEEELEKRKTRAYGSRFGFGFGRPPQTQGRGQGQKHISGYTSNYEGSQSSFRARKSSEMKGRSTRFEPQNEDNEDLNFNSDVGEYRYDDKDQDLDRDKEEGEGEGGDSFPNYRRHRGRFRAHTPRYHGSTRTPSRGSLPTQPPPQLQSIRQVQPSPEVHQPLSTKQQSLTKHLSMKQQQQQRRQPLQFPQSDAQTRPHVESDSDESEARGGTTTAGGSVLISETNIATAVAPSTTTTISATTDSQSPNLNLNPNPILHSIPIPNPDLDPNPKLHPRTNHYPHSHSQSDSHYNAHYPYPESHSDSHVALVEDTTESDLDMKIDSHDLHGDGLSIGTAQRIGSGDALLPSLGYLDEALSFIAAERARWSAARESSAGAGSGGGGGGVEAGGNGDVGAGVRVAKGGEGKKTGYWKVLDYDIDAPKRKRRRKRPPRQQQQHVPGLLEPSPDSSHLNTTHTADEGGGPSTSSSAKKVRPSSWSPAKKKNGCNSKGKEKAFLIAPPSQPPLGSSTRPPLLPPTVLVQGERDQLAAGGDGAVVVSHSGPEKLLFVKGKASNKQDEEGGRTPTNGSGVGEDVFGPVNTASMNLSGKRGKKLRKKGRERERVRKDLLIEKVGVGKVTSRGRAVDEVEEEEADDNESDDDDDDDDDDDFVSQGDLSAEGDSSLNDLSILQPPHTTRYHSGRQKGKDLTYIHNRAGIGAYKSTPGSPKGRREFDDTHLDREGERRGHRPESLSNENVEDIVGRGGIPNVAPGGSIGKKRTPKKRPKGLVRVRSVPQMRSGAEELYAPEEIITPSKSKSKKAKFKAAATSTSASVPTLNASSGGGGGGEDLPDVDVPRTKRSRLITLAKKLRQFFPEQRQELRRVIIQLEKEGTELREEGKKAFLTRGGGGSVQLTTKPAPITIPGVRKSKRSIYHRTRSESASADIDDDSIEDGDTANGDGMPEIEEGDEEELDPRGRPPKKSDVLIHVFIDHSNILIGLLSHLRRFALSHASSKETKRRRPLLIIHTKATPTVSMNPALAFAAVKPTSARPLPHPNSTSGNGKASANTSPSFIPIAMPGHLIPLPSFATVSRSLPSGSVLNECVVENDGSQIEEKDKHSDTYEYHQGEDEDIDNLGQITGHAEAWKSKELEKKPLKHLWHAALVLLLERGRSVTRRVIVTSSPLYQPMDGIEQLGYELRVYARVPDLGNSMDRDRHRDRSGSFSGASKSAQSTVSFSGLPLSTKNKRQMGHVRRVSGNTSAESGSGSAGASNLHPYHKIANNAPLQEGKIKYREQGVDELLQLKLHQALAATDDVPEGSTIVLATGDGNMGEFNEEGFLGPVRTALKRGWKVELYAWEDGLSRAWRREFGEGTEWGRKGMFRVIGMEQFAANLVEVVDQ